MKGTLGVFYNGKKAELNAKQIFDNNKYDSLSGVTYSASGPFVNEYIDKFSNGATIIIGIPEKNVETNMARSIYKNYKHNLSDIMNNRWLKMFNKFSARAQEMLRESKIRLFTPAIASIHSKFYLLSNSVTGESRVIIGSANLSSQAFSNNTAQFEDILISDNNQDMFEYYKNRFNKDLLPQCTSLSDSLIEILNKQEKENKKNQNSKDDKPDHDTQVVIPTKNATEAQESESKYIRHKTETKIALFPVPVKQSFYDRVRNSGKDLDRDKQNRKKQKPITKTVYKLIKSTVSPRSKVPKPVTDKTFNRKIKLNIRHLHEFKTQQVKDTAAHRSGQLLEYPNQRTNTENGMITGLKIEDSNKMLHNFGKLAAESQIKEAIDKFVKLYQDYAKYVDSFTPQYFQRVMEAFIYVSVAPFLSEIEKKLPATDRRYVHEYLFIGGKKGSGKSDLIRLLKRYTGLYDNHNLISYNDLINEQASMGKAKTIKYIKRCLDDKPNVAPFFLDELPGEFFSDRYGGNMIKDYDNRHDNNNQDPFPAFIGTTNEGSYNMNAAAKSRSYYLTNNKEFSTVNGESARAYTELAKQFDNVLFKDFVVRFAELLEDPSINWNHYDSVHKNIMDFLYQGRRIFAKYFRIAGFKKLPDWFPKHPCDDSSKKAKREWRNWYEKASYQFKTDANNNKLIQFDIHNIVGNTNSRNSYKAANQWRDYLPTKLTVGDEANARILVIKKKPFFEWIGINPSEFKRRKDDIKIQHKLNENKEKDRQEKLYKKKQRREFWKKLL